MKRASMRIGPAADVSNIASKSNACHDVVPGARRFYGSLMADSAWPGGLSARGRLDIDDGDYSRDFRGRDDFWRNKATATP